MMILAYAVGVLTGLIPGFVWGNMLRKPAHDTPSRLSEEDAARRVG